jgi:hypothetical protein
MPTGDGTKQIAFRRWLEGKSLAEIQREICSKTDTLRSSVRMWIIEWERAKQGKYDADVSNNDTTI